VLPPEIAFRKKAGFPVPIRSWLADARYNRPVRAMLQGPIATKFFKAPALNGLWERFIDGETDLWRPIYAIHAFLVWYGLFFPEDDRAG
jgi:asparagine synthase (glutamine-hydrolysing)